MSAISRTLRFTLSTLGLTLGLGLGLSACSNSSDGGRGTTPTPMDCTPGTEACACAESDMCGSGLECQSDLCVPAGCTAGEARCVGGEAPQDAIKVSGGDLRGCDLLFAEGETPVASVSFANAVVGEWVRRDGLVALSFVGPGGASVEAVGAIVLDDTRVATSEDVMLLETQCFDAEGRLVEGAEVVMD